MRTLMRYLRPYRSMIIWTMVFVLLQSIANLYLPTLMSDIVNEGVVKENTPYILKIGGLMLLVSAVGAALSVGASYLASRTASGFGMRLRSSVFSHVERFSLQEFDKLGTASLITRTTNDITQLQQVLIMMLRMMVMAPMMCIGGIIMAVSKDAKLSLVIIAVIPVLALAIYLIGSKGIPYFKAMQTKIDKLNLVLREYLTGIRVVRAFNRTDHERERFDAANEDLTATSIKAAQIMAAIMPVMMLLMNVTSIAIIWFGGLRISEGHIQVGDLMAFLQYAMQILFSLMMASMMFNMLPRASASAARIREVLQTEPVIVDRDSATAAAHGPASVVFDQVSFRYPGAEKSALSGISFEALPGQVTAIIGGTGSGKTTLVSLIPRFYDVESGSVRIGGVDVRELSQEALRSRIGFVPQKALLFSGTIADNIRYGKEDATDEELCHAAEIAQASEFIAGMKDGFDSVIAQGGMNVSGGQKQRLSIARALIRKPDVYVFDDSFSALDYKTDARLRAALKDETQAATVIIVAQRVSTVMDADQIIVLEEGGVAGIGTHAELMETCGVYREIVTSQQTEEEIA
ncbi:MULTISPECIES: ABC transporter ATP-binding protein [Brevibacillus]|uniref:ABC transporter-like protein n=1 Tax=Brevibacillus borstelensis AK1 TaxID=1300222 RepID=M8DW30_9BACL|nr:ABC transporter ATP-binding protein [Brevibacillus borstelensis]EMT51201.1 ABC transporter-like protein [Brevibacillus borstelensis AK1]MBE5394761.1 ABC transporter ATP-binding protein [Brevibacillus borstelensis]MCC0566011.1 ABC transporter ATP-binding protein/permease [Brevibacillus borstelensis]MCM3469874.1 ABC transporter ATP-binding protein/permease [Brevibacillus borstelensis]MCM3560227.1 ABC transporter ATP-binding protein/permease [Brevibacillus borstelensis]